MTLQEAIKSGKRFRRKFNKEFFAPHYASYWHTEDICADDWEVETVKKELSREDIEKAYKKYSITMYGPHGTEQIASENHLEHIIKELGL